MAENPQNTQIELSLDSIGLPHQIIAFSLMKLTGLTPKQIVEKLSDTQLRDIYSLLTRANQESLQQSENIYNLCLQRLSKKMNRKLGDMVKEDGASKIKATALDCFVGETTLRSYYTKDPEVNIAQWGDIIEKLFLVTQAQQGSQDSFESLYILHKSQIFGFIRVRVTNDSDAEDIAQKTWIEIWQKISTYDATRASFQAFAKYWASILLLRHFRHLKKRREVEALFSEILSRFPNFGQEEEAIQIIDSLTAHSGLSVEEEMVKAILFDELLQKAFAGSSSPHQMIAFGLSKLLELEPKSIVAELSTVPLRDIEYALENGYMEKSQLPKHRALFCFKQLRENMDKRFEEVVKDRNTLHIYPQITARIVGETTLQDYYTSVVPEDNIVQWRYAVERRIKSEVLKTI